MPVYVSIALKIHSPRKGPAPLMAVLYGDGHFSHLLHLINARVGANSQWAYQYHS